MNQVTKLINHLTPEEQLLVFEQLARQLRDLLQNKKQSPDLYGLWQQQFPQDFDLDIALNEIRQDWEKEWRELTA